MFPPFIAPFDKPVTPHCYDVIHDFCLEPYPIPCS
jgi:hypothetical protein